MNTKMTPVRVLVLGLTASFLMSDLSVALATDGAWTNGLSGNWSAPSSWAGSVVPGGVAAIANFIGPSWAGSNPYVTVDTNAVVGQLLIGGVLEGNNQTWHFTASIGKYLTLDSGDASPVRILGTEATGFNKKHNIDFNVPLVIQSDLLLQAIRTDFNLGDGAWITLSSAISEGVPGRSLIVSNVSPYAKCFISGNNYFSGSVLIQSGLLKLLPSYAGGGLLSTALGASSSIELIDVPGALDINNHTIGADKTLLLSGQGVGGAGLLISSKVGQNRKGTWSGPVVLKGNVAVGGFGTLDRGRNRLLISGDITEEGGSYQLNKVGDCMLYLRGDKHYSGGTVIGQKNVGNITYGGVNVSSAGNLGTGPVIFNGGMVQFDEAFDLSQQTLSSTNSQAVKFDTNGKDITLAGNLTPAITSGLSKYGLGTLTLSGANSFGCYPLSIYGGTLTLDYTSQPNNKLGGGYVEVYPQGSCTLKIVGTGVTFNESVAKLYFGWQVGGELTLTNLSDTVQFSITRSDGLNRYSPCTLDFGTSGGKFYVNQALGLGNIMGGFVTYGKTTWATKDGSSFIQGLMSYDSTWTATDNKDVTLANSGLMPADGAVNTVRFNNTDSDNVPLTMPLTGVNVLSSGGILVTANMGSNPVTMLGGQLTATNRSYSSDAAFDVTVHQHNTHAPLVIASSICNSSAAVGLTKSGLGVLVVSNSASTFTGPIYVNNGRLTVYSPQDLGGGNQGIFLRNGSVVQMVGTYSIANKISIDTIGGGVDVPTGSSITLTAGDTPALGNYQSVFRKTGDGVLTLGSSARETGEFSIEGGTLVADSIYRFGWAGTIITLTNNATIKKRAILNHGEADYMLKVAGTGGRVDLDGESATLNAVDYLNGNGTLVVMNSGAGSPTFKISYQQATFTGVLDVQLGSTTFQCADIPNAVLKLGPTMTWTALNGVTKFGGLSGSGTFNFGGNTVLFGGMGDSEFSGLLKGSGTIVKQGTGTWALSSSDLSQFTGALAISNGTFAANSVITSPVTLAGSGTLGGTGTVTQVTMTGGSISPANDGTVGTLTIGSSLNLDGSFKVDVRGDGSSDLLQVNGDLALSATSSLTVVDTNQLMRVGSYVIATWSGTRSGTIGILELPPFWSIQYNDASKKMILQGPPQGTLIRVM
jgi:autotransporter-associated beta strand protein